MNTDRLSRLLEAERGAGPTAEATSRGLERLLGDLTAQVAPLPIATGSLKLGLSLVPKWLVVGFALGLGGAGAVAQLASPVASASPPNPRPSALARLEPPSAAIETVALPPAPLALEATAAPLPRAAEPAAPAAVDSSSVTTFDAELRLITLAKQELERGKAHLARAWLDEHAQRYAGGVFAVEREALRVLVSCAQHRDPSLARQFTTRYPGSALSDRVLRSCSTEPAAAPSTVEFPK